MKNVLATVLALFAFAGAAEGQGGIALLTGERLDLPSKTLGETRRIIVSLPSGYAGGQERYPVLYLLDGQSHVVHTRATVDYLAGNDFIPNVIIVAIPSTGDRTRDLTPTRPAPERGNGRPYEPTAGGGPKFLEFIEAELVPLIEAKYRTAPFRLLCGHSLGGLFAIDALVSRPALFQAVVAASPSLDWDGGVVIKRAEAWVRQDPPRQVHLFATMASEGDRMQGALDEFEKLLAARTDDAIHWAVQRMPDEDHTSVVLRSHYQGLRMIFDGWWMPRANGVDLAKLDADAVKKYYAALSSRFGFTAVPPQVFVAHLATAALDRRDAPRCSASGCSTP